MPEPDFKTVHLLDLWKSYEMKNRPDSQRSTLAQCLHVPTCWGCGGDRITEHFLHSALAQQALWSDQWKKPSTLPQHSGCQKLLTLRIRNSKHFFNCFLYSNNQDRYLILPWSKQLLISELQSPSTGQLKSYQFFFFFASLIFFFYPVFLFWGISSGWYI